MDYVIRMEGYLLFQSCYVLDFKRMIEGGLMMDSRKGGKGRWSQLERVKEVSERQEVGLVFGY